ncbi:MAG: hypothetical protein NUW02_00230 [Candidatus Campbellbacteria bacterium]|nr:hypothetical protein [Candidatus Campbellbacteria bacterium]
MKFPVGTVVEAVLHHSMGDVGVVVSAVEKTSPGYKNGELFLQYTFKLLGDNGTREMPEFWLKQCERK